MNYINYKFSSSLGTETIDETETRKEAKYLVSEYQSSDPYGNYWISQKPCKAWIENNLNQIK
tara:strand:+ start:96 stop:281 length:186 start_codon:yes stop_codon:yes gene_type:complete